MEQIIKIRLACNLVGLYAGFWLLTREIDFINLLIFFGNLYMLYLTYKQVT